MNIPPSVGRPIFNRDVFLHTISTSFLSRLGKPAQPMLPILPILPKKVMLFATMLSNSLKKCARRTRRRKRAVRHKPPAIYVE
jgi:hypothetical protein